MQFSHQQLKAARLLALGISPSQVAQACGLHASDISHLIKLPEFRQLVADNSVSRIEGSLSRDDAYNRIESLLLDKFERSLPLLHDPMKILRALEVINHANRAASALVSQQDAASRHVVSITLNSTIIQSVQINAQNQVVAINGQEMASKPSSEVLARAKELCAESSRRLANSKPAFAALTAQDIA